MTTVIYTPALEGIERREISVDVSEYKRICEMRKSIFEKLPDDIAIKLVFDFDFKKKHANDGFEFYDCTPELIDLAKKHMTAEIERLGGTIPPKFAVKTANQIENSILSFHLICINYKMTKKEQSVFFGNVERLIENDSETLWRRDYLDAKPDTTFIDLSVYSRNRFLRSSLSTKTGENRPFEIVEGTFEDTVISIDNHNAETLTVPIPEKIVNKSTCVVSGEEAEEISAYLDAGMFVKLAVDYKSWIEMGFAIFGACGSKGLPLFLRFSALCPDKYDEDNCREWYERLEPREGGRGLGSIKYLAKLENPEEYKRICKLFQKITTVMSVSDISDAFKCAEIIQKSLKQYLIFCKEKWYMLNDENLWVEQKEPSFYVVREIRKYLDYSNIKHAELIAATEDETIKNKLLKTSEEYLKCYKAISSASYLSVVVKFLKTHLRDDTFDNKLNMNAGFLAFKNGIINLQTGEFRYGIVSEDFISATIPHDYKPADATKKAYLKSILLQILNNNKQHLEYFLSLIGFTFIGTPHLEKSLYFCVDKTTGGDGDNGKSFFFDILDTLLPNYVHKSKSNFLEESNTKVHKQLAKLNGIRLVWLDEFGKNKANAELMKVIGDGTTYEYEVMFGTTAILDILFKMFVLTNHLPNIDPNEKAVYNRYKQISYASHFDRTGQRKEPDPKNLLFIADPTLKDKILADYTNEVFGLIIDYAKSYYVNGIPEIPSQFLQDTKETQNSNDPFVEWFEENMEVVEGGRIALKSIVYAYGKSEDKVKEGMKRLGYKYNKDLSKIGKDDNGKAYKGGYEGIGFIETDKE
jgi:phage/plasmid-associated DNA primase